MCAHGVLWDFCPLRCGVCEMGPYSVALYPTTENTWCILILDRIYHLHYMFYYILICIWVTNWLAWRHHDMAILSALLDLCEQIPLVFSGSLSQGCWALTISFILTWTSCWTAVVIWDAMSLMWRYCTVSTKYVPPRTADQPASNFPCNLQQTARCPRQLAVSDSKSLCPQEVFFQIQSALLYFGCRYLKSTRASNIMIDGH